MGKPATTYPRGCVLPLGQVAPAPWHWKYDDAVAAEKLATSLRAHGQLQAVVVRALPDGRFECIKGRRRVAAMRALGWAQVSAVDVGPVSDHDAVALALALELRFDVDYAKLAAQVAALAAAGRDLSSLAAMVPWDRQRLEHFVGLSEFDWSQFKPDDDQHGFDWEAAPDEEPAAVLLAEAKVEEPQALQPPEAQAMPAPEPEPEPVTPPPAAREERPALVQMGLF